MKYIIITDGTWGDLLPFIEVAKGLKEKGNTVIVCTNEFYKDFVTKQGLQFVQTTPKELRKSMLSDANIWKPFKSIFASPKYVGEMFSYTYPVVNNIAVEGDVLIAHSFSFTAPIIAQLRKVSHMSLLTAPIQVRTLYQLPIIFKNTNPNIWPQFLRKRFYKVGDFFIDLLTPKSINIFLRENNLPKISSFIDYGISKELSVGLWPDWYSKVYEDQKSFLKLAGFPQGVVISKDDDMGLLDWISKGEKPIVVTMGSGYFFNTKLVKIITEVSKKLSKRFIVIVQEDTFADSEMIIFKKHINLQKVLPLCSLFIYHGGAGSVAQAITTGVPSIVVSMAYDQPDNAYHIVRNKLGVSLCEPDLSVSVLITKIQEILLNKEIHLSIQEAQNNCINIDGIKNAAEVIEEFGRTK